VSVPKGYKRTEVGVIPEEWEADYIENVAHITTGSKNTQDPLLSGQEVVEVDGRTVFTA
jgi:hypothetical protein